MASAPRVTSQAVWRVLTPSIQSKINLRMTLCGGQCFQWYPTPRQTFIGVIDHDVFELREVRCPAAVAVHTMKNDKQKRCSTKSSSVKMAASVDDSGSVCCWIEYRKLWPQHSNESTISESARTERRKHLSSSSPSMETEEELLTRYLSLDVDLAALWLRWTDAPTTRQHPLVTYLIGNSQDSAPAPERSKESSALPSDCSHNGAAPATRCIPIRHVRQDVHSCLFAFLCSQNNNVTRITKMVHTLCSQYGDHLCDVYLETGAVRLPATNNFSRNIGELKSAATIIRKTTGKPDEGRHEAETGWFALYSFPSIEKLAMASEDELRRFGFGYRSKYIVEAAKAIAAFSLPKSTVTELLFAIPALIRKQHQKCLPIQFYADLLAHQGDLVYQRHMLQRLCGVGRKVADCVLLFSLAHANLVPVDTHMAQIAVEYLTASTAVPVQRPLQKRTRRRSRHDEKEKQQQATVLWKEELLLWRERANRMKTEALKKTAATASMEKKRRNQKKRDSDVASLDEESNTQVSKLPVPPLYERHHDAIQEGFTELFGPHAGWAHSIFFYYRMKK